jgi:hypothetical protein
MASEAKSAFLAERQRIYTPQIETYRQAAAKLYPNVQNISAKLVFVAVDKSVDCC